jgi:hypothetical protein
MFAKSDFMHESSFSMRSFFGGTMVTPFPSGRLSGMLGMPSSPWTPEPENITKLGDKMDVGPAGHNKDAKQHDDDDMDAHDATMNKIIHDDSGVEDPLLVTHMTWKDEQKPPDDKTGFFNLFGGKKEKLTLTQRKEQVKTTRIITSYLREISHRLYQSQLK